MSRQIAAILARNKRVEADKAWETSITRRAIIAAFTYLVVVCFLWLIAAPHPAVNAFVPVVGYILSTLSLPYIKQYWILKQENKD